MLFYASNPPVSYRTKVVNLEYRKVVEKAIDTQGAIAIAIKSVSFGKARSIPA